MGINGGYLSAIFRLCFFVLVKRCCWGDSVNVAKAFIYNVKCLLGKFFNP